MKAVPRAMSQEPSGRMAPGHLDRIEAATSAAEVSRLLAEVCAFRGASRKTISRCRRAAALRVQQLPPD